MIFQKKDEEQQFRADLKKIKTLKKSDIDKLVEQFVSKEKFIKIMEEGQNYTDLFSSKILNSIKKHYKMEE